MKINKKKILKGLKEETSFYQVADGLLEIRIEDLEKIVTNLLDKNEIK